MGEQKISPGNGGDKKMNYENEMDTLKKEFRRYCNV